MSTNGRVNGDSGEMATMTPLHDWLVATATTPLTPTDEQIRLAATAVRDLAGVAVAGTRATSVHRVERHIAEVGGSGPAIILGSRARTDPVSAALLNGTAAQAFDYDDIAPSCVSHVSAIMVPAITALLARTTPERALAGYVRGLMVIDRLAEAFTHEVYDRGIQPTHTMGPLGAVTALLSAIDADEATASAAFGMVATQMIGLRAHTGTRYKPAQAGIVAAAAVRSVLLAAEGLESGAEAVDVVMRLMGITDEQLTELARPGELQPVPLAPKFFPTCGASHTAIESTIELRNRVPDRIDDPSVTLRVSSPPRVMNALEFPSPATPDEARFSMQYVIATAWCTGAVTPDDFSAAALERAGVRSMMERIEVVLDDALTPPPTWSGFPAIVRATWTGGADEQRTERPRGYPERPMSEQQLHDKFRLCADPVLGEVQSERAFELIQGPAAFGALAEAVSS